MPTKSSVDWPRHLVPRLLICAHVREGWFDGSMTKKSSKAGNE
jgi:hypothetical protein